MAEPRPIAVSVLSDGCVRIDVGDDSLLISAEEFERLKCLLTLKPVKRETS